jgi:hypothetical protein
MAVEYEYKFVSEKLKGHLLSGADSGYRDSIVEHARDGWRLVQVFAPVGGVGPSGGVDLIFERPIETD